MSAAHPSRFVYTIFIRTTPARLWEALTDSALIRRYWFGAIVECDWTPGSPWIMRAAGGPVTDAGEIVEIEPLRRIVIRWRNEWNAAFKAEGPSRCTIELEPIGDAVKLTVTHEIDRPESPFIAAVAAAWPYPLSNLKSLLETGDIAITVHPGH